MSDRAYERTLRAWAAEWRAANLGEDRYTRELIANANYDLWYGPHDYENWPGFETACREIKRALKSVPSTLYVDTDAECWTETEPPQYEQCPDCEGGWATGIPESDGEACETCDGTGEIESATPSDGGWWEVSRRDLVRAIVGKELAEYVL